MTLAEIMALPALGPYRFVVDTQHRDTKHIVYIGNVQSECGADFLIGDDVYAPSLRCNYDDVCTRCYRIRGVWCSWVGYENQ